MHERMRNKQKINKKTCQPYHPALVNSSLILKSITKRIRRFRRKKLTVKNENETDGFLKKQTFVLFSTKIALNLQQQENCYVF